MSDFAFIVTDTSPLITLAKADQLDLLLRFNAPIEIPDIVYFEAAKDAYEDGRRLKDWVNDNKDQVRIAVTSRVTEWLFLKENNQPAKGYGELAAIEVINDFTEQQPDVPAVLIYEDADMNKFRIADAIEVITTGTLLASLEEAQVIQSKDQVLDQAAEAGRNVEKQREQPSNDRVTEALQAAHERNQETSEQIAARIRAARERNRGPGFDR